MSSLIDGNLEGVMRSGRNLSETLLDDPSTRARKATDCRCHVETLESPTR